MKQEPLVSVIVPAYNVADTIERCLNSIQQQNYSNLEIIVVNDGSTDQTQNLIEAFQAKTSNVILINSDNQGISAARNQGISAAQGEYLTFVDADDTVETDYVSYLVEIIMAGSAQIASCQHIIEKPNKKDQNLRFGFVATRLTAKEWLAGVLTMNKLDLSVWAKIYRADLLRQFEFPVGQKFEDTSIIPLVVIEAGDIVVGGAAKYHYQLRTGSITRSTFDESYLELLTATKHMTQEVVGYYPSLKPAAQVRVAWALISCLNKLITSSGYQDNKQLAKQLQKQVRNHFTAVMFNRRSQSRLKLAVLVSSVSLGVYGRLIRRLR